MAVEDQAWEERRARFLAGESVWLQDDPRFSGVGVRYQHPVAGSPACELTVFEGVGHKRANEVTISLKQTTTKALIALLIETL